MSICHYLIATQVLWKTKEDMHGVFNMLICNVQVIGSLQILPMEMSIWGAENTGSENARPNVSNRKCITRI